MRKANQAKQRRQQLMALAGTAATVAACFVGWQAYNSAQKNAVLTVAANKDLQTVNDKVKKLKSSHDKIQTIAEEVGGGLDRNHPSVDVLYALNAALPAAADIWLTQFQFERGGLLTLHGETKRALEATQLVLSLQKSGAFTDVRLTYVGDSQDNSPAMNPAPAPTPTTTVTTISTPVAPVVPTLPAPASFGGFPGGAGGFNPGAGGRFGGNGQGPTVITPSNGATFTPPNGANFPTPNGGNPNFPNGGASFPVPGGVAPNGVNIQGSGNIQFTPNDPNQPNPGFQGAPQPFIPPTPIPAPVPGGTSAAPASRSRQAGLEGEGGNLILAGWQGPVDNGGGNGGNGNGGNGNGGNGNRGGRGGGRRNRGNGGNYPNFDPNATGGNFNPGNNGGNNPGSNPGSVNSSAPTYSTGSIFGATPSNPNVNTPPDPNANQNPNFPNPNFPGGNRRFRNGFGGGGFGGNPLSAPLTTPPGGIQRVTRKIVTPVRPKTNPPKQTLTSFVITCRVNMKRADLVPAGATIPTSANKPKHGCG